MAVDAPRSPARVLNYGTGPPEDGLKREWDVCPKCGQPRWQLYIVPDRFYCDKCEVATFGPNTDVAEAEPEQIDLFGSTIAVPSNEGAKSEPAEEGPPIDEGDAWIADEMPDE